MTIVEKAFKGISWLALFRLLSQIFSWAVTVYIARILAPDDYGLMVMATIITGYAEIFNELGFGAAIIQKEKIITSELSSVFWFSLGVSCVVGLSCFPLSFLTAYILNEPKVIPLTQTVSVIFILSGLQIIPLNLIKKELNFKFLGFMAMVSTLFACLGMIVIAQNGGGVWTLLGGRLIGSFIITGCVYGKTRFYPDMHFNYQELKPYLKFGLTKAFSGSVFYFWTKSDQFLAGRAWNIGLLGYYSLALQLSKIPTEKIVSLINQVAFSAFSKLQKDKKEFNKFYLSITKISMLIVCPIFLGGYLTGEDIVKILLTEKWSPIIDLFRYLCLAQIFIALNANSSFVHFAQGRPQLGLYYQLVCAVLMPVSFYLVIPYGLNAIIIPWLTINPILCLAWVYITIRIIDIKLSEYLRNIMGVMVASTVMFISVKVLRYLLSLGAFDYSPVFQLGVCLILGCFSYCLILWKLERELVSKIKRYLLGHVNSGIKNIRVIYNVTKS